MANSENGILEACGNLGTKGRRNVSRVIALREGDLLITRYVDFRILLNK